MLLICSPQTFETKLSDCLTTLLRKDGSERVRASMCGRIIDISDQIKAEQLPLLLDDFFAALNDSSMLVVQEALGQLKNLLNLFVHRQQSMRGDFLRQASNQNQNSSSVYNVHNTKPKSALVHTSQHQQQTTQNHHLNSNILSDPQVSRRKKLQLESFLLIDK